MSKYFFDPAALKEGQVMLGGETARHLRTVLRIKPGDPITLCDGQGFDYQGMVSSISRGDRALAVTITERSRCKTEPPVKVVLCQSMPKADKLEWIIQKSVELGVWKVQPVVTRHSVTRFFDEGRLARFRRIAQSAAEQSLRGIVPEVGSAWTFEEALDDTDRAALSLVAYEDERDCTLIAALRAWASTTLLGKGASAWAANAENSAPPIRPSERIHLWIGPEGGFAQEEIEALRRLGVQTFTLGPRVLRTETAALAALVRVLSLWEA